MWIGPFLNNYLHRPFPKVPQFEHRTPHKIVYGIAKSERVAMAEAKQALEQALQAKPKEAS